MNVIDDTIAFDYDDKTIFHPDDPNRQQLAWANFTGPLSKYIADNELFNYDVFSDGTVPRKYYGRFLSELNYPSIPQNIEFTNEKNALKVKDDLDLVEKIKNSFGELQQSVFSKQVKANFFANILGFIPFIQNFNVSPTGSIYGLRLLNDIFPFTDTFSNQDTVYVLFFVLKKLCEWLTSFVKQGERNKELKYKTNELNDSWNKINSDLKADGQDFFNILIGQKTVKFKVQSLMNKKGTSVFDALKDFVVNAKESFSCWTEGDIKAFKRHIITQLGLLKALAKGFPKLPLEEIFSKVIEFFEDNINSIDLFKGLGELMIVFADNQDQFLAVSETDRYQDKAFEMLGKKDQNNIATLFGYNGEKEFEKNSILDGLFSLFNDPTNIANKILNDLLLNPQSALYQLSNVYSEFIHNTLLQYALDKNYWKILSKSFKMKGAITGKASIGAKFSYSVEYNGKGDKTVTKFLNERVELPENFDPVLPWVHPTNVSKGWSVQDYIDYTGLGNGDFKDVKFKYDVEWSNVSGDSDLPYWIITKIDCFREDKDNKWIQFYPVM